MTQKELKKIVHRHHGWIRGKKWGVKANLSRANLYEADLSGANLSRANLYEADLSGANLYGANLSRANLYEADLSGANLYGADLHGADLSGANLYGADLSRADLSGANLSGANLYGADLYGADLHGANLSGANLYGANLHGVKDIFSFGPIGSERRICYAVRTDAGIRMKLGCFWGTVEEACIAIRKKYGNGSTYENCVLMAEEVLK